MIKKINDDHYLISIQITPAELDVLGKEVTGKFQVEIFNKNFGTFEEDLSQRHNLDVLELFLQGKFVNFYTLPVSEQDIINNYILKIAQTQLNDYLTGPY